MAKTGLMKMFWWSRDWRPVGYVRQCVEWIDGHGNASGQETYLVWKLFVCSKTAKRKYRFKATGDIKYFDMAKKRPNYGSQYDRTVGKLEHWRSGVPVDFGGFYVANTFDLKCIWSKERYDLGDKNSSNELTADNE